MRKILTPFTSPRFGNCVPGEKIDVSGDLAQQFEDAGMIEKIETKPEPKKKIETKPKVQAKENKKAKE